MFGMHTGVPSESQSHSEGIHWYLLCYREQSQGLQSEDGVLGRVRCSRYINRKRNVFNCSNWLDAECIPSPDLHDRWAEKKQLEVWGCLGQQKPQDRESVGDSLPCTPLTPPSPLCAFAALQCSVPDCWMLCLVIASLGSFLGWSGYDTHDDRKQLRKKSVYFSL